MTPEPSYIELNSLPNRENGALEGVMACASYESMISYNTALIAVHLSSNHTISICWHSEFGGQMLTPLGPHHILTGIMSESMGDVNAQPKPGTALKIMVMEHRYLDEFLAMVKAKMELDENHVRKLGALRDSWNPQWNDSGIWPLISPLLTYIGNEITHREEAATELASRFSDLPNTPSPNSAHEDGFDPLEALDSVHTTYYEHESSQKTICTPESIGELERWQYPATVDARHPPYSFDGDRVLPKHEREYRRAVVAQQTAVERAVKWQRYTSPAVLERHQQRAEDVKTFLSGLFNCYGNIHFGLSASCSTAVSSTRTFSPSMFIAPRHRESEQESSHALLHTVEYHNFMLGGVVSRPIFGLGAEMTLTVIKQLEEYDGNSALHLLGYGNWEFSAFELERKAARSGLLALFGSVDIMTRTELRMYAYLLDTPLLPLDGDFIKHYQNGVARLKLSSILRIHLRPEGKKVLELLVRVADGYRVLHPEKEDIWEIVAIHLSHNRRAAGIMESIWRKWNIEANHPLPEGVERMWNKKNCKSELVWKKTGDPCYPRTSDSQD